MAVDFSFKHFYLLNEEKHILDPDLGEGFCLQSVCLSVFLSNCNQEPVVLMVDWLKHLDSEI